jgi:hypothetical protein
MLRQPRPLIPYGFGQGAANGNLRSGLVGWWKMDESSWSGTSGEVIDSSGSGNHGTAKNGAATTSSPAKFGNAGSFTHASNQYVDCGHDASLFPSAQITIAAWVYPLALNINQVVGGVWDSGANNNNACTLLVGQDISNAKLEFVIQQSNNTHVTFAPTSNVTLTANTWQHVAGVADGSVLRLYLNGVDCGSTASYNGTLKGFTSTNFWIGHLSGAATYGWGGGLNDFRVYNRGLSASELLQLYNLAQ